MNFARSPSVAALIADYRTNHANDPNYALYSAAVIGSIELMREAYAHGGRDVTFAMHLVIEFRPPNVVAVIDELKRLKPEFEFPDAAVQRARKHSHVNLLYAIWKHSDNREQRRIYRCIYSNEVLRRAVMEWVGAEQ
jgi:hypothetical protein